jgi:hypothetical protein
MDVWSEGLMSIETKYLHLREPAKLGEQIDGWRICWLGGWDRMRVFYVVMGVRAKVGVVRPVADVDRTLPPAA